MDYAPYFYGRWLDGDYTNEIEVDGMLVTVWDVTAKDRKAYPSLGKKTSQVAFYERDDGFWVEIDVPDEDFPDAGTLANNITIESVRTSRLLGEYAVAAEGRRIAQVRAFDDALKEAKFWMRKSNVSLNIYYINERGNVSLLNTKGDEIKSWV